MQITILEGELDITPLIKAKTMLDEAIMIAKSPLERTGAIQCFEYCYELSWKTMKRILHYKGVTVNSPRDAFREAVKIQLISDPEQWFSFILKRNLSSHTYDDTLADEIFDFLPEFQTEVTDFIRRIRAL